MNNELDILIEAADIVRVIKTERLSWLRHLERLNANSVARRIARSKPEGRRVLLEDLQGISIR